MIAALSFFAGILVGFGAALFLVGRGLWWIAGNQKSQPAKSTFSAMSLGGADNEHWKLRQIFKDLESGRG